MVPSHEPIIEENIRNYFQTLHKQYDFSHREGINRYKFVAKNPHACVWDESHILLDKYLEK